MRELLCRLEIVDDAAASALRVIAHFDGLVEDAATGPAMLRAAAALAGCPAGWHDTTGLTRRTDPAGRSLPDAPWTEGWPRLALGAGIDGVVWLERCAGEGPLDTLLLERLAKALTAVAGPLTSTTATARRVRVACNADLTREERRPALISLGLTGPVTIVVTDRPLDTGARLQAIVDGKSVALVPAGTPEPALPAGVRAGAAAAEAEDLPCALRDALVALALAAPILGDDMPLRHSNLGALVQLVEQVTPEWAATVPDVVALCALQQRYSWLAITLASVASHASLRQAASTLHIHHSTLQQRMTWIEEQVGYAPTRTAGRQRLALALAMWRIALSGGPIGR